MCTDISRMCCFVSSLRISQIFKQEARVAEILHYRNRRDAGKYRLSPHPVQGRNQSKFFPSKFGTFLPRESERLPREGNAGPEKHPRHQTDFSHPPQLKLTRERNLLKKPLWKKSALAVEAAGGSHNTSSAPKSEGRDSAWKRLSIRLISQV